MTISAMTLIFIKKSLWWIIPGAAAMAAISQANKAISDFNNMCVLPDYNIRTIYR